MYAERHTVSLTTDGSGDATGYTPVVTGAVLAVIYTKDGGADAFANGVDFDVTLEATGEVVWDEDNVNSSKTVRPLAAAALTTGAASTITELPIVACHDRVKVKVAQGGDTKVGSFTVVVGG